MKPNKEDVQICSDTISWINARPQFLCARFVYESNSGHEQSLSPTFRIIAELVIGQL